VSLHRNRLGALAAAGLLLLAGCATVPEQEPAEPAPPAPTAEAQPAPAPAEPPPASVADALLPPVQTVVPELPRTPAEPRFDVDVDRAPARAFFMGLVKGTPYNMVVHPDVAGQVSLSLKNVTIPEVMDMVRDVYGYEYTRGPAGFVVLPARLQSKIFYVDYLSLQRLGQTKSRVTSGELSSGQSDRNRTTDGSGSSGSRRGGQTEFFGSRIETRTQTDYWEELRVALQTIVGSAEGRSVVVSPQSSTVVVRAMPGELRDVEQFLASAQDALQRQVVLEAKILEVTLSDGFQTGINWAAVASSDSGNNSIGIGQTGGGTIFGDQGVSEIAGQPGNLDPTSPSFPNNALTSAFGGVFSFVLRSGDDFAAFVELLERQGDVQVLSSPRVSAMNNQKALIKVGTDEFFVTEISTTTTTGTATTTTPSVTLTPFFSGIALDVTPQISDDQNVLLHIRPSVSEVVDQNKEISFGANPVTGQPDVLNLPLAFSTVRESDTIVRARNGQIVVIGGLMQEVTRDQEAGIPGLKNIPGLGYLFKHIKKQTVKTELVILLKPIVVASDRDWQRATGDYTERFRELGQSWPPVRVPQ
jgi:MSHA biogenesis protein MshL